jgi:hypothetical protein
VGPLENPQETYEYYHLPFCKPDKIEEPGEGLGEALMGFELRGSVYEIQFMVDVEAEDVCRYAPLFLLLFLFNIILSWSFR